MLVGRIVITKPEEISKPNPVFAVYHNIWEIIGRQAAIVFVDVLKIFELVAIKTAEAVLSDDP